MELQFESGFQNSLEEFRILFEVRNFWNLLNTGTFWIFSKSEPRRRIYRYINFRMNLALKIKLYFHIKSILSPNTTAPWTRASLNTLLENFLFIYPRGRARPARPREERYRSKPLTPPPPIWLGMAVAPNIYLHSGRVSPRLANKRGTSYTNWQHWLDTPSLPVTRRRNARATAHRPPSPHRHPSASHRCGAHARDSAALSLRRSLDESNRKLIRLKFL